MTPLFWLQDARTIIVTRHALEAEDLAQSLAERALAPAIAIRSLRLLEPLLLGSDTVPHLVVIGVPVPPDAMAEAVSVCWSVGCRVLLIDGEITDVHLGHVGLMTRPFASEDLDGALRGLGLRTGPRVA